MTDNKSILLGASDDFRIRHTGSHSEITDEGTGNLRLGSNQVIIGSPTFDETSAKFVDDGAVELYYDNSKKFETLSTGVKASGHVFLDDSDKFIAGTGSDLQIYHNGTNSIIDNNTGVLSIQGDDVRIQNSAGGETGLRFIADGAVELYHDGTKRLETNALGVSSEYYTGGDNAQLRLGDSGDLQIYHNGSHSFVDATTTGDLYLRATADDLIAVAADDLLLMTATSDTAIRCEANAAVELYHDNAKKLQTQSGGIE